MNFSKIFIDRPIFASVLSILIVLVGSIAYQSLPIAQYPEVAPPTIVVRASYSGASPQVIAETVATPIEQEVNGVEDMLYMSSQSASDGAMTLTITFKLGTDLDKAQVLVQNRVAIAEPRLPEDVRRVGVTTLKRSPDLLLVVHMVSPDDSYDQLYISNYATLQVREQLKRVDGVGDVNIFGAREYSMRVWLDPSRAHVPKSHDHRNHHCPAESECAGRRRRHRPAAARHGPGFSGQRHRSRPAGDAGGVRERLS